MNERGMLVMSAALGAALGVAVGYLFFTDHGRQLRREFEPEIEGLVREVVRLRAAVGEVTRGFDQMAGDEARETSTGLG